MFDSLSVVAERLQNENLLTSWGRAATAEPRGFFITEKNGKLRKMLE